ncbi:hypothetical protein MKW94_006584, partial [Papaver nudicaule]|nr:hypothetical protein [Papaver nudicaule]
MRLEKAIKKNNDDLEKLLKDGCKVRKVTMTQLFDEFNNMVKQKIDERWEEWSSSSYELWKKQNEEERRRDLHTRWTYLRDMLHREGIDTSNHRLLMSMKFIERDRRVSSKLDEEILELRIGSPDRGLV